MRRRSIIGAAILLPAAVAGVALFWRARPASSPQAPAPRPPAPSCSALHAQVDRDGGDPLIDAARAVERRVSAQFFRTSSRELHVRFVRRGPPLGIACPDGQAYLTRALLERVLADGRDSEELLALVIAHELAHLRFDFGPRGFASKGELVLSDEDRQIRADQYGAFMATLAGWSMLELAEGGALGRFLEETESGETSGGRAARRQAALEEAVASFDFFEEMYRAGIALEAAGLHGEAAQLLDWVDGAAFSLVPEIKLARALIAMERGAMVSGGAECGAIFPGYTALIAPKRLRATKGEADAAGEAAAYFDRAQVLLGDADRLGVEPIALESAAACLAIYRGDRAEAARRLERARKLEGLPQRAYEALAADEALLETRTKLEAPAIAEMRKEERCDAPSFSALFQSSIESAGTCRAGFTSTVPESLGAATGAPAVIGCARGERRSLRIRFPRGGTVALDQLEPPPPELSTIDRWRCACGRLGRSRTASDGTNVRTASCPERGLPLAVLITREDNTVSRATAVRIE